MNKDRRTRIREIIEMLQEISDEEFDAQGSRPDSFKDTTYEGQKSEEAWQLLESIIFDLRKITDED
jgi:hypothetical protein